MELVNHKPNNQFKSDSPRLAFLVWVKFSGYGIQIELCGSVVHTLIGRYVLWRSNGFILKFQNVGAV